MAHGKIEKRGQRRRKIKPVILIVTEGSQTEPKYFEHYRNRQTNIDIRVVGSRTSGGETDYLSLIRKAVEYQNKNQISVSEGDSVWVVADGDVNYNNPDPITAKDSLLSKARKMADAKGIQIALSNPCFEFWYLLHFQYTTKFFKDYPAVKNALTTYLPDYEKAGDVYNQLAEHTAIAIQNAKRVEQYHLQNDSSKPFGIAVNPSCQHFIMRAIRATRFIYCPALNDSFPLVTFFTSPYHFLMRTNRNLCRFYLILF